MHMSSLIAHDSRFFSPVSSSALPFLRTLSLHSWPLGFMNREFSMLSPVSVFTCSHCLGKIIYILSLLQLGPGRLDQKQGTVPGLTRNEDSAL